MRRGLPVSPMACCDSDPSNPVNPLTAGRAVKDESVEFAFQIGLHVQKFEAQHLRLERHGMRAVEGSIVGLVHDGAGVLRLLGNGADGPSRMSRSLLAIAGDVSADVLTAVVRPSLTVRRCDVSLCNSALGGGCSVRR